MAEPKSTSNNNSTPKKTGKAFMVTCISGCVLIFLVILGVLAYMVGALNKFFPTEGEKAARPAPERNYVYHEPSAETKNRTIDCTKVYHFDKTPARRKPLCLNLYRTTPTELKSWLHNSSFDSVILYGERVIFEANPKPSITRKGLDYAEGIYDFAKFSDQITVPRLMELYKMEDLSFFNQRFKSQPYDAVLVRMMPSLEVAKACNSIAAGCAAGWMGVIVPENLLSERRSHDFTIRRPNGDYASLKYKWPENCLADDVMLHEISHILLISSRVWLAWNQGGTTPNYFNEYVAGLVGREGPELVCGKGTITYESQVDGKKGNLNLVQFNSIYPPIELSHDHPTDSCELAALALWNQEVAKSWPGNFGEFFRKLRATNKAGNYVAETNERFGRFILNFSSDPGARGFLNSHGCSY